MLTSQKASSSGSEETLDLVSNRTHEMLRPLALDALAGGLAMAGAAAARIGIEQFVGGIAPFILTFPVVMLATLARGGRAGTIAAVSCQLLTIRFVFPNWISQHGGISTDFANVALSTLALGGTLWATSSYRQATALLRSRCERQVHTLSLLISEIDHRTKNNFQIAAGLLAHQSITAPNADLAIELEKASLRLEAISSVYQDLSRDSVHGERVELAGHVERIVSLLREGATPDHVGLSFRGDHVEVPVETAIIVGLIVNEWVTNALKHAFGELPGEIVVEVASTSGEVEILVRDNGSGDRPSKTPSQGSDLMSSLADVIQAEMRMDRQAGMQRVLTLPSRATA